MSEQATHSLAGPRWIVPMRARSPKEGHRASTPLELLFDLVFVVAISRAAASLHHGIAENHIAEAILGFVMLFFAIWWAWMNFTWFASAYDTDDVPYRLMVMVQLTGALILAAGVGSAFAGNYLIVTLGYVVMRFAMVGQWLRAARSDPPHARTTTRYAIGITLVQVGWLLRLLLPASWQTLAFFVLVGCELLVPTLAERGSMTTWHPAHIAERYGLLTIIVLGESILSATVAIQSVVETGEFSASLVSIIVGGIVIIFSMWWLYFDQPVEHMLTSMRVAFTWGYGHYVIFASAAAVGGGLAAAVDHATHHTEVSAFVAGASVAFPVALYILSVWALHQRPRAGNLWQTVRAPLVAVLIALTPFTEQAVLLTGILIAALLGLRLFDAYRAHTRSVQRVGANT